MDPRIAYVLDTFRHLYAVPDEVQIVYGDFTGYEGKCVRIRSKAGKFFKERRKVDTDELVFKDWQGTGIPFLFENSDQPEISTSSDQEVTINYDIIAAAFYFLSGWQEYVTPKDKYADGRFPYRESLQYQLQTAHIPWVNYYFDILKTAIEQLYGLKLSAQRGDTDFHIAVTHDIDTLYSGWYQEAYHAIKKGNLFRPLGILLKRTKGESRDPWNNLGWLQDMVRQMESNATFYFLTNSKKVDGKKQADYDIQDPKLQQQIQSLQQNGAEIGIHGSIGSHLNAGMLKEEIKQIDASITGGRFHFLYYDIHNTPHVLQETGIQHDSTLGFAEQVGFRNAFTHPFYLYDLEHNRRTDVLEIPLLIMDATLQHRKYMNLKPEDSFNEIIPILQEVEKFNGVAAILWHNSYFSEFKYEGWGEVFEELLNYCKNQNGSAVTASELVSYYTFETT